MTSQKIDIMQAALDGQSIECQRQGETCWLPSRHPSWNWAHYNYRALKTVEDYAMEYRQATVIPQLTTTTDIVLLAFKAGWEKANEVS